MSKCPKCGGTNGFTYNLIMKTNRIGDWGLDNDEETDVERIRDVKTVTCVDCGKRIDWNIAHGLEEEEISTEANEHTSLATVIPTIHDKKNKKFRRWPEGV